MRYQNAAELLPAELLEALRKSGWNIGEVVVVKCLAHGDHAGALVYMAVQLGVGRDVRFLSGPIGNGDRRSAKFFD